jgi:CheY-like chemotaxis protein
MTAALQNFQRRQRPDPSGSPELFLIIDDEPDAFWAFEHILEQCGGRAARAASGREALVKIRRNRFHLAFLDAKLPDVEGLELARQIHELDREVRIVVVSGYYFKGDSTIQTALAEGLISGFIPKPFQNREIVQAIMIALQSGDHSRNALRRGGIAVNRPEANPDDDRLYRQPNSGAPIQIHPDG